MRLEPKFDHKPPTIEPIPAKGERKQPLGAHAPTVNLPRSFDIRNASPRHLAKVSMDFYVAGLLDWEEYAMLANQPELHPDFNLYHWRPDRPQSGARPGARLPSRVGGTSRLRAEISW